MRAITLCLLLTVASMATANPIFYEVENLTGDRWEYVYTVDNQTADPIEEFTIFFDLGRYENLELTGSPNIDWDGFVAQPDPELPDDGFADWLAFGLAIDAGTVLSGFSVAFDWLDAGTPGEQFFQIIDPLTFDSISEGFTQPLVVDPPTSVPEPASLALFGFGLLTLLVAHRRRRSASSSAGSYAAFAAALIIALPAALLLPSAPALAGVADLSVTDQQQISKRRAGRAFFDYTYTITLTNANGPLDNVVATVTSQSTNTRIIEGSVNFGNISGGSIQSSDTFTMRQNRRVLFNPSDLVWTFTADTPAPTNTAPTADAGSDQSVGVGSTVTLTGAGSTDPENDPLTYQWSLVIPSGSNAQLSSTTAVAPSFTADAVGDYTATLTVNDGSLSSPIDTVVLTAQFSGSNAPSITSSAVIGGSVGSAYSYEVNATDPDLGDTLTYSLLTSPTGMTVDSNSGLINWVPSTSGGADVDVQVTDSTGLLDRQIFLIAVTNGASDLAPSLLPIANQSTFVGAAILVQASGTDPENETLRYSLIDGPTGMGINTASGELVWTPNDLQTGSVNATVSVSDPGGQSAQQSFSVVVSNEAPNNAPVLDAVADQQVNAQSTVSVTFAASDSDAGDTLAFSLVGAPDGAQFDPQNATFSWVPTSADTGTANLVVTVKDALGASDSESFAITVLEIPTPPVAVDDAYAIRRGDVLTVPADGVLTNDIDANNDVLSATATSQPTLGALDALNGDGSFTYTTPQPPPITIGLSEQCRADKTKSQYGAPAVADLDGDGIPEIITLGNPAFSQISLEIRDGSTCAIKAQTMPGFDPAYGSISSFGQVSVGDIDGDGDLEIIVLRQGAEDGSTDVEHFIAFDHELNFLWVSESLTESVTNPGNTIRLRFTGAVLADINGDGSAEILVGTQNRITFSGYRTLVVAYAGDGQILWEFEGGAIDLTGRRENAFPIVVADLDLDGTMEILNHNEVLSHTGELEFVWPTIPIPNNPVRLTVAVGNFDNDPYPEVVGHDRDNLYLFNHDGSTVWRRSTVGEDRPASFVITLADIDADGQPEIIYPGAIAANNPLFYSIRAYEGDGSVKWTSEIERSASHAIKVLAFDMDSDGADELIYNTGRFLSDIVVVSGADGRELFREPVGRGFQNPTLNTMAIADVDADGAAELIWTGGFLFPRAERPDGAVSMYIFEGLPGNPLAPARPIYTHWGYEPAQVNTDGSIPQPLRPQWLIPGLNSQNAIGVMPGDPGSTAEDSFTYVASDVTADSNEATVSVQITPNVNPPVIVSMPALGASPGFEYNYGVLATDADFGDTFNYTLVDAPSGMSINNIGLIRWTPATGASGSERVSVAVTDSQGNNDSQTFEIAVRPPVSVPDLLGQDETMATDELTTAGLALGDVRNGFSNTVPIGQVISQSIIGGGTSAAGAIIDIVLSLGPQPIYVPDVIGLTELEAIAKLQVNLLTAGTIVRANSDEIPAGAVFAQDVDNLDEVPPGTAISFTVSTGPALLANLSRSLISAGEGFAVNTTLFDNAGVALNPQPPVNISIIANAEATGAAPALSNDQVSTAGDTRGGYTLSVDAGSFGQRNLPFYVRGEIPADGYYEPVAQLANTLERLPAIYSSLTSALAVNDLIAVQSLGAELVSIRASIDLDVLASRHPAIPDQGFWPTSAEAGAAGFQLFTSQVQRGNFLYSRAELAIEESRGFLANLNPTAGGRNDDVRAQDNNGRLALALNELVAEDMAVAMRVHFNSETHVLLSQLIPELVHTDLTAMIDLLASNGLLANVEHSGATAIAALTTEQFYSTTQPTFFSLSGMLTASSIRSSIIKDTYVPYITNVISAAAILARFNALREQSNTEDLAGIVTGASLSFHTFQQGNSIIEAPGLSRDARSFQVQVVGPDKVQAILNALLAFEKPSNAEELDKQLKAAVDAGNASANGTQTAKVDQRFNSCFLEIANDCVQLVLGNGFPIVHSLGKFPAPVIVMVTDNASGTLHIGIYPFLPKP